MKNVYDQMNVRKPCSVLRTPSGGQPRTKGVIICLQAKIACPSFGSKFPIRRCPYQYLGCSLVGFTAFHLDCFQSSYVTVALSR